METGTLQLQLHYYFDDDSRHSLEAFTRNENEKDILLVFKKTCEIFNEANIIIEVIPGAEGGLIDRYRVISLKLQIGTFVLAAFTAYWSWRGESSQIQVNEIDVQLKRIELHQKLTQLADDSLSKAKLAKLGGEIVATAVEALSKDYKSRLHRSKFYGRSYKASPAIRKISTQSLDTQGQPIDKEKSVTRTKFNEFVLRSGSIAPFVDNEAVINIIAPVIDGPNHKWKGYYNGGEIQFSMSDPKFKQLIQFGEVKFTKGSTIECVLQIKRKFDENTGEIRHGAKTVLRVNAHTVNKKRTEYKHTRKLKHEQKPGGAQLGFFERGR